MKSNLLKYSSLLLGLMLALLIVLSACNSSPSTTPSPTPTTTTPPPVPGIVITSPGEGGVIPHIGDIAVTINVTNFNLVNKLGQANVPGEGHIHYFMDVNPPTTQGQPAVTAPGTYVPTTATSYTWKNVGGGPHTFSVELVNNNHTPLLPPVVATISVTVVPEIGVPQVVILQPKDGANVPAGGVMVMVQVSNFNLADKLGQANVPGEGHIHYFLDVTPPTTQGQPAIPPSGSVWAATANTTYTFNNVAAGQHTIYVELVNNNHTPLDPPVVTSLMITAQAATTTTPPTTTPPPTTTTPSTTTTPPPTTTPPANAVTISLVSKNIAFDKSTIRVPAGARVTINFNNQDSGIPHNVSVFTDASATTSIFLGDVIIGPAQTVYTFTAPATPGTYFFRCDIHPNTMTGSFIVTAP